jgi:hypothetical protein
MPARLFRANNELATRGNKVSPQALERTDKAIQWLIEITAGGKQ